MAFAGFFSFFFLDRKELNLVFTQFKKDFMTGPFTFDGKPALMQKT